MRAQLLGFSDPVPATTQQMATAIMLGKCILREDDASYYEYDGNLYVLPKKDPDKTANPG